MAFRHTPASKRFLSGIVLIVSLFNMLTLQGCSPAKPAKNDNQSFFAVPTVPAFPGAKAAKAGSGISRNHLKGQVSPYLLDHANDPVDWYPWGDEAFARAKRENKPIFLSSGFAACHWCHVMHRESFEDPATAKFLNDNFVSIKVDREERPYVDEIYSRAAQAIGGRGGWPLTVFLTPDKKPFFAGTYFPNTDKYGLPAFTKVLDSVLDSWHKRRDNVDKLANELCLAIYNFDVGPAERQPARAMIDSAGARLLDQVDKEWGGLYGERKFALPGTLVLAMQFIVSEPGVAKSVTTNEYSKTEHMPDRTPEHVSDHTPEHTADRTPEHVSDHTPEHTPDFTKNCLAYVTTTLNQMAIGGVHDQLHGGFFRYAIDRTWHIPHFEKMLCDNALIAQSYFDAGLLTGNSQWKAIGLDTLDFCLKNFAAPAGGFYGSIDADSGGQEGAFYTFTQAEI